MNLLLQVLRWEFLALLVGMAGIVFVQLLNGEINSRYLLFGTVTGRKMNEGRYFSPERVQLLVFTLGVALYYLTEVMTTARCGKIPEIPLSWLVVLGGSNASYLGGKAYARWLANNTLK
jgi:hypothetical protein